MVLVAHISRNGLVSVFLLGDMECASGWKPISLDQTNPKVCSIQSEHNLPDSKVNASLEAEFQAHVSRNLTFFQPSKRREANGASVAQN